MKIEPLQNPVKVKFVQKALTIQIGETQKGWRQINRNTFPILLSSLESFIVIDYMSMQSGQTSVLIYENSIDNPIKILFQKIVSSREVCKTIEEILNEALE